MHPRHNLAYPRDCRKLFVPFAPSRRRDSFYGVAQVFALHELHENQTFAVTNVKHFRNAESFTAQDFTYRTFLLQTGTPQNRKSFRAERPKRQREPLKPRPILEPFHKNLFFTLFA